MTTESPKKEATEDDSCHALGLTMTEASPVKVPLDTATGTTGEASSDMVPNPHADQVDLSDLRGTKAPTTGDQMHPALEEAASAHAADLEALSELVPALKSATSERKMTVEPEVVKSCAAVENEDVSPSYAEEMPIEVEAEAKLTLEEHKRESMLTHVSRSSSPVEVVPPIDSMSTEDPKEQEPEQKGAEKSQEEVAEGAAEEAQEPEEELDSDAEDGEHADDDQNLGGFDDVNSEHALQDERPFDASNPYGIKSAPQPVTEDSYNAAISSAASLSTATQTQTHEVRMPMFLPTFKPATGCTNASDFIVRCFVARLRSGITVVKHGRSRWCKSRLRILHIHPDGRSLSWKPAVGEPTSSKRPPKLDLSTCMEVRHAWSPDPLNPMFTGTPILRQKCEAANAHKSFALVFPKRTVDITAVTADQCKVLMEGFSALCFRLQVANLAGRKQSATQQREGSEDAHTTTASVTLTNSSNPVSPPNGITKPSFATVR
eukprot:CAMPEP_0194035254 /NCGR_PEP_ID=MMETSP0009_2-20130614/7688_1 /TAXON_ID=210454 /ORGANISM="Grammatophora oceanica, Strain CCMP 410" /LENGTH=490 /DNA_ID=CAMNT_0038676527 /DNA_START=207 /DNA_END=1679 /DNA_ORIENTATION=+